MPASARLCSASGASGTRNAASRAPPAPLSSTGRTASSGWKRADDPATAITRSYSGAASIASSAGFITSYRVPARVRSRMRPWSCAMPAAASRATVAAPGPATSTPRMPSWSTTIAAPPPVVVTTPTTGRRDPAARIGRRRSSGGASSSASNVSTRAMPQSRRKASATSSSPASAPVWDCASSAAAADRPSL